MRIAVIGAGSLGIVIGAFLSRSNLYDVTLVDADAKNVQVLNEKGATTKGAVEMTVPVKAIVPEQMHGVYDLALILTKQIFNESVLTNIKKYMDDNTLVCSLQNGMPEEELLRFIPRKQVIGGSVGFGATWLEPGVSLITSSMISLTNFAFYIGELDGQITDRIKKVAQILSNVGHCDILDSLIATRWTKIMNNSSFSGMSAALGCTFGQVLDEQEALYAAANISSEVIKTLKAAGYSLVKMQGEDKNYLELAKPEDAPTLFADYKRVWEKNRLLKASMLQDLEKGRRTEIDFINGYVCKKARGLGVATPYNDMVVTLVKEAEQKGQVPSLQENIKRFIQLKNK